MLTVLNQMESQAKPLEKAKKLKPEAPSSTIAA
jgi:hypothetical protein